MKTLRCSCDLNILIDDADYEKLLQYTFRCIDNGRIVKKRGEPETPISHLIINERHGLLVDHINRDTHDNQRNNLRLVTFAENCFNRGLSSKNKSGYKGVFAGYKNTWRAQIKVQGVAMNLGNYPTKEQAAKVYNEAAIKHFGEYAYLNQIPSETVPQ